jgi:hypothetical protein
MMLQIVDADDGKTPLPAGESFPEYKHHIPSITVSR